jgi:hypothetical protein
MMGTGKEQPSTGRLAIGSLERRLASSVDAPPPLREITLRIKSYRWIAADQARTEIDRQHNIQRVVRTEAAERFAIGGEAEQDQLRGGGGDPGGNHAVQQDDGGLMIGRDHIP